MSERLDLWIAGYRRAWEFNDPADISAIFAESALYYTEPYSEPWLGREEIIRRWLSIKDEPGETEFGWEALVDGPDLAIVRASTVYHDPAQAFSNLWVIRFDGGGLCSEFTEWWMEHPAGHR